VTLTPTSRKFSWMNSFIGSGCIWPNSVPVAKGDGSRVRSGLAAGGSRIRTFGPSREGLHFRDRPRSITPAILFPRRR
jgi:hypothetical protein